MENLSPTNKHQWVEAENLPGRGPRRKGKKEKIT